MNKVAIYARVSTTENQEYDRQISDLTKVINFHGYNNNQIEIFAEKLSGYTKERPELNKLLSSVEDYKCIYVTEISRLGRNPSHTRQIIDELTEKNIPVYIQSIGQATIDKDGKRNVIMSIVLQVLMEFSHLEAEQTKSRMRSGKIQKVKDGGAVNPNMAFGYKNENKKLVIDEGEAAIVRMIFQLCKDGVGSDLIAQKLNQMEIPTRRSLTLKDKGYKLKGTNIKMDASKLSWSNTTIRQIIKNPIYYGKRIYKGETYDCPAIISEELFTECNQAIKDRSSKRDETYTYLLKNLMYCGVCGKKYMGMYQQSRKAQKVYLCTSNLRTKQCCNGNTYLLYTESIFYDMFLNTNLDDYIDNPDEIKTNLEKDIHSNEIEINGLKAELTNKKSEQDRLALLFIQGSFNTDTLNQLNENVISEINAIQNKLQLVSDKQLKLKLALANYNDNTTSTDLLLKAKDNRPELRKIFNQMIDKIIVNKINDTYTLLTYYIKVKGVVLPNPLKVFINMKAAARNKKTSVRHYRYMSIHKMENEPVFKDGILMNDIKNIEEEMNYMLQHSNNPKPVDLFPMREVAKENMLIIGDSDL